MKTEYRILQFSPSPEFMDPVNVALLLNSDGRNKIIFDRSFKRLKCQAPGFNEASLSFLFSGMQTELERVSDSEIVRFIKSRHSQIKISAPQTLAVANDEAAEKVLKKAYLMPWGTRPRGALSIDMTGEIYVPSRLEQFITERVQFNAPLLKRASPDAFLSRRGVELLGANDFQVQRVLIGDSAILLVDGLSLRDRRTSLEKKADEISYGYYLLGKHKPELQRIEKKEIERTTVLFDSGDAEKDSHLSFCVAKVGEYSDLVVRPDNTSDCERFTAIGKQIAPTLL